MTTAYARPNGTGFDLVIPDLSGADGFDPTWALSPIAQSVDWFATRTGGDVGLGVYPDVTDGAVQRSATITGSFRRPQ